MKPAKTRFSKAAVLDHIRKRRDLMEKLYCFDPRNGRAQVNGEGEDANLAYGAYCELGALAGVIEGGYL